ncbi:MAG: excinuclease ABC subunit UvrC [Gemmatimonadetes bacterium]|nr:excinuclease ABC subunit UvrC [Gemmatimonadota bacterium]
MPATTTLDKKLRSLPARPGVYIFKDRRGGILYIGKAKSLRARVRSHFATDDATSIKNHEMVRRVRDVDSIVVDSEAEALLLEANLIKAHHPRFNIRLRDDKKYPYIKVTVFEAFPRVWVTRRLDNDGSRYFGPFTEVGAMRQALELIKRLYTVRSCRYDLPVEAPERPCLDYHIGRCKAPCVGLQDATGYRAMIDEMLDVLGGRTGAVRQRVHDEMQDSASALDYERAATLRDVLAGLESIERRQRAFDIRDRDIDVLGLARDGDRACAVQLRIRAGKLLGRELDFFSNIEAEPDEALVSAAATRMYFGRGPAGTADLPREVLLPADFEDRNTLADLLAQQAGRRVEMRIPLKGEKARLIDLANQNARHLLEERTLLAERAIGRADDLLYELQDVLAMKVVPRLAVCFDISHAQGTDVVGSAVVFSNGEPDRSEYRKFRVRGDWGNDDVQSMAEVVSRYFRRRIAEARPLPDLAIVDGGRGQLAAAHEAATAVGVTDVTFAGLAKREEDIYLVGRPAPVRLARNRIALRALQRMRDEAHRFANTFGRNVRTRRTLVSRLASVPGVGPVRQRKLLERFGSVRALRSASREEVASLPGFSAVLADRLLTHLRNE